MRYKITPFIVAVVAIVIYALYTVFFISTSDERKTLIFTMLGFLVPTLILIVGADYLMQKYISKIWLLYSLQIVAVGIWLASQLMTSSSKKILVVSDSFTAPYIIVVLGVDNAPDIPAADNFKLVIPEDGVLLTSAKSPNYDLEFINGIETTSGKNIDYLQGNYQWIAYPTDSVEINNKQYFFNSWVNISVSQNNDNQTQIKSIVQKRLSQ